MATVGLVAFYLAAVALLLTASGCTSVPVRIDGVENRFGVHLSKPFDNARDEGPNYLVGPLGRHSVRNDQSGAFDTQTLQSHPDL